MPNSVKAPFSDEQVAVLNEYQKQGNFHPYTCAESGHEPLVATRDGWHCPNCDYKQKWAHALHFNKPK